MDHQILKMSLGFNIQTQWTHHISAKKKSFSITYLFPFGHSFRTMYVCVDKYQAVSAVYKMGLWNLNFSLQSVFCIWKVQKRSQWNCCKIYISLKRFSFHFCERTNGKIGNRNSFCSLCWTCQRIKWYVDQLFLFWADTQKNHVTDQSFPSDDTISQISPVINIAWDWLSPFSTVLRAQVAWYYNGIIILTVYMKINK